MLWICIIWASRIRIRHYFVQIRIQILPSTSKKSKKNLDFYYFCDFFLIFFLWNWCKCTFKKYLKKTLFLLASCQPLTKKQDPEVRNSGRRTRYRVTESYTQWRSKQHAFRGPRCILLRITLRWEKFVLNHDRQVLVIGLQSSVSKDARCN